MQHQYNPNIPYGYCQCGCGGRAPIADRTHRRFGWVKGEPKRFIQYHRPRGEGNAHWQGGITHTASGYVVCRTDTGVQRLAHRWMVEQNLGRSLRPDEDIHHINGIKSDNRLENLHIISKSEHTRLHLTINRWSRQHDCCVYCGRTDSRHVSKGECNACYMRRYTQTKRAQRRAHSQSAG